MDIVDCILADHDRQRRMFVALEEARDDPEALGKIWHKLKHFLEAHAASEERHFYPALLEYGCGALDFDSASDTTEDAIHDHNEITDAAEAVSPHPIGSPEWWSCVDKANLANSKHMSEEERQGLTDFRRRVPLEKRVKLGTAYLGFESEHEDHYHRMDKDPETYIKENSDG